MASLLVTYDEEYTAAIKAAARREARPVAGWVRSLIMKDLAEKGLVDPQTLATIPQDETT